MDANILHWENWVRETGKEVVSLVKKKRRQEQDAERISSSNSKAIHLPNRATNQVLSTSPTGPDQVHVSNSKHGSTGHLQLSLFQGPRPPQHQQWSALE